MGQLKKRLGGLRIHTALHKPFWLEEPVDFIRAAWAAPPRAGGCDHTHYPAHTIIAAETLTSLAGDLR